MAQLRARDSNGRFTAKLPPLKGHLFDTLANLLTGMGVLGRDKGVSTGYALTPLTRDQLEAAYRGDWVARKAVNIPALDATREWRSWQADKQDITKIEDEEQRLDVQRKVKRAMILGRLYGGGALLIGAGDEDVSKELKPESVAQGGLRYLHVVSCNDLKAEEPETDVNSEFFGEPKSFRLTSRNNFIADIHPSRVVRFIGNEYPDTALSGNVLGAGLNGVAGSASGWGDSILQGIDDAIKAVGTVSQGVAQLVHEAKLDIIQMPNLDEMVATSEYRDRLQSRIQFMNVLKSIFGVTLLDERDKWDRKEVSFGTLPDLVQMYLLIVSGASDIPATRFLGQSPAGLNATGESDIRNYYDRVRSEQTTEITPRMHRLDECVIASSFGSVPPEIWYEWRALWASTDSEKADVALKKAQAFQIDVNSGLIDEQALKEGRENQLIEDGTYPGFEQALEEAEAAKQAALNELDPEVRAMAEEHLLRQAAGLPMLPAPAAAGAPGAGGPPSPSGQPGQANQQPPPGQDAARHRRRDRDGTWALGLSAGEARRRRLRGYTRLREAGRKQAEAMREAFWITAAKGLTEHGEHIAAQRGQSSGAGDDSGSQD